MKTVLCHHDITEKCITLKRKTYDNCNCKVFHAGVLSELIKICSPKYARVVCCPPFCSRCKMRRTTEKHRDGIQLNVMTRLEDLDFADDSALLSCNHQGMQYKLTRAAKISANAGLRISKSKAKGMRINTTNADRLQLDGEEIDEMKDFAYLGNDFNKDRNIRLRIGKVRTAFTILIVCENLK